MGDRLFEGDWNYALNTIYRLNELEDLGVFQRKTLELIRLSIPFCQGIFYTYKRDDAGVYSLRGDPVVVGMKALYLYEFDKKYSRDVFFTKVSLSTHDKVIRDTDMMPDELRMNTEWYKEIYAKQGIHYALRSHLTYDGVILGSVDFFRAKEEVNFSDKEMDLLGILSPHITLKLMQLLRAEGAGSGRSGLEHRLLSSCGLTRPGMRGRGNAAYLKARQGHSRGTVHIAVDFEEAYPQRLPQDWREKPASVVLGSR